MTDDDEAFESPPEKQPNILSSLPNQQITDDIVKQIGESDHPKIKGAMRLPGTDPRKLEAFQLDLESKTYLIVFDPREKLWKAYASFGTEDMAHEEVVNRAAEFYNDWLAETLSDRMTSTDETGPDI